MKNCHKPMMVGAILLLCAVLFLPLAGVTVPSSPLLLSLVMLGCCVLPMLLMVFWSGSDSEGREDEAKPKEGDQAGASGSRPKSCH
ncbi:MAG: hypothetical protein U0797_07725 [Gemmataceae bacterium]